MFSNRVEYHFVCLSETWMSPYSTENYEVKNYTCITRPRTQMNRRAKRGSGGLILYIHEKIKNHVEILKDFESMDKVVYHNYCTLRGRIKGAASAVSVGLRGARAIQHGT